MANKAISELPQAQNVNNQDLFVLEQSGIAKKLPAETFITEQGIIDALAEALDGHGGIQSVTLSSVSGRIRTYRITFTDQSATTFQVYDGTTIERIAKTSTAGLVDTYTIFMNDGTTTFFTVTNGADGTVSEEMLNDALKDKAPAITETTESSAIANFTDGADDMVMHNVVAEINPVQDLSNGDPSPSNICPITGHTEVNVTRTGKNLLDVSNVTRGYFINGANYPAASEEWAYSDYIPVKPSQTYYCTVPFYTGVNVLICYDSNKSHIGNIARANHIYTVADNCCFVRVNMKLTDIDTAALNYPSTATTYEPYQGETVTVDWTTEAGTVYGGTIDVATGLLTVDKAMVDLGTLSWAKAASSNYRTFTGTLDGIRYAYNETTVMSSAYVGTNGQAAVGSADNYIWTDGARTISIKDTSKANMSASEFKTAMSGVQLVYELATPQTYQLTPQEVKTLLGTNNVWADTGNTSVTYPADTKMFIEKLTMPTEDDMTANQAIASGTFFMVGQKLYLSIASIASGAQIIEGTNARQLSLADALNTLSS